MIRNPLSFLQNIDQNISVLVRDALSELGVENELLNNFDLHSTIEIALYDSLPINISLHEDRLLIWSSLSTTEELLITNARLLIGEITKPIDGVEGNGCFLLKIEGSYDLRAVINLDSLKNNQLDNILMQFHERLKLIDF
ncbi:hypothetical protein HQQ94_20075 [Shewanella sp. VB17]|uniref:InvB/SpaK family type III secretion system chaperone n=1 Tax=Shewanella sp. VB17 TaxID=2739432 RepID=UPI0015651B26|nr:hypothetical protein [Shewanella sp. VB17]NRD75474.1 hypothetical protein [Shewanella sp. VB17]